ncbi:2-succinyl-6-hydroxy-2, 4-cyclohexadiene-1-carboxylate synthase [Cupriavidus pampae]|uniref:2-succinyl-6-hydroxy-2, 4-cyclohexadiene-1-carboxylate synthase n=1 Tax=Cupriavidus pampae TaxID=659251 RepID=A0ABN7ZG50_9BURK|nr:2-succinyl-6-hydroxy-2, 4-cyclohexadiene-1-carboxylate synthase [Cupriavidus pampae]
MTPLQEETILTSTLSDLMCRVAAPVTGVTRRRFLQAGATAVAAALAAGCANRQTAAPVAGSATQTPSPMRTSRIRSSASDAVELAVFETGNPNGRPVIFIHGFAQSSESWSKQLSAPELQHLRLIAFDLRGHGDSAKPLVKEAYHDNRRWAEDVRSVIRSTGAQRPAIVTWSYGGRVVNDYLTAFGDGEIGSLNYVAATSTSAPFGQGRSARLMVPMMSDDAMEAEKGTEAFLRACFARPPSAAELAQMERFNAKTPVAVRKLLAGRPAAYDDTLRAIRVPMLVTHGREDQISAVAMSEYTHKLVPHSTLSVYEAIGHGTFFEDPTRFNAELLALLAKQAA